MKKFLIIFISIILCACGAMKGQLTKQELETIHTLLVDNDHLYVLGSKYDYQFTDPILTKELPKFLQSKYKHKIVDIKIHFRMLENNQVNGGYRIEIDSKSLTNREKQDLIKQYKFQLYDNALVKYYGYIYRGKRIDGSVDDNNLAPNGHIISLQNKSSIMEKYKLNPPLPANLLYIDQKLDASTTALSVGAFALSAPFVVLTLPVSLPLMIMCMANSPCN